MDFNKGDDDLRRSDRPNKPSRRYVFEEEDGMGDGAVALESSSPPKLNANKKSPGSQRSHGDSRSVTSIGTHASSVARRRLLEAELDLEKTLGEAETEMERRRLQRKKEEREMEDALDQKTLEWRRKLAEKRLEITKQEIKEEQGISDDDSDLVVPDDVDFKVTESKVDKWLNSDKMKPLITSTPKVEFNADTFTPRRVVDTTSSPLNPGIDQLALILSQALGNVSNVPSPTTDKFLARQWHLKDLPTFSGKLEEWPAFICNYRLTTSVCGFSDAENLIRLQKTLKGDAMKAVQCLMTTPNNVPEIIKFLELRYGQPEHIVENMIEKAKALPQFKEEKLDILIEFGTAVRNLTTTMTTMNCSSHMNNPTLLKELEQKLPVTLQTRWMDWVADDPGRKRDLTFFSEWMSRRVEIACKLIPPKSVKEEKDSVRGQNGKSKVKDENVLVVEEPKKEVSTSKSSPQTNKKCLFCSELDHKLQGCKKFQTQADDVRYKFVREKKLCFGCLNYGHSIGDCRSKKACGKDGCEKFHHRLLHRQKLEKEAKEAPEVPHITHVSKLVGQDKFFYSILPVTIKGPRGSIQIHAMLDSGSRFTLLDEDTAKQLGLELTPNTLSFKGFGSEGKSVKSNVVDLEILNEKSEKSFILKSVNTYPGLSLPRQTISSNLIEKYPHLKKTSLVPYLDVTPKLLIGIDQHELLLHNRIIRGRPNDPVAVRCKLGWYLAGQDPGSKRSTDSVLTIQSVTHDEYLHRLIKNHFSTEDFGVKVNCEKPRSRDDKRAQELTDKFMKKTDGRWETPLLWKSDDIVLPESRNNALKRLFTIERKMDRDPIFAEKYAKNMNHYLDSGYARMLSPEEVMYESPRKWYLPHFAVTNPNKPEKVRMVFDAAARSHGQSLNDNLVKGPDQVNPLQAVLSKFRQKNIAMTADIKEMFHRVGINPEDQHSQRFLWRGMDRDRDPDEFVVTVMTFGSACSPYCAQEAKNRNAKEFASEFPEAVKGIVEKHYVDDYLENADTVDEAFRQFQEVKEIHSRGNFHICNFITNSRELSQLIPEDLRSNSQKLLENNKDSFPNERVLGLVWDPNNDDFVFKTNFHRIDPDIMDGTRIPTKREALSLRMSIFDPMGFLAPLTIKAGILLQDVWRTGIGWDDELPTSIHPKWKNWILEVQEINKVKIPRNYSKWFSTSDSIQLHIFCDASESAFSAVAYFRVTKDEEVDVTLVTAKTRVAPLKPISIPRMELQAAVMATRLKNTIHQIHEFPIRHNYFWTDSSTVMDWLRSDGKLFQQFVSHRIGEIQESTDVGDWKWLPTLENVADEATRDQTLVDLSSESRWLNGPQFLKQSEDTWNFKPKNKVTFEDQMEFKKSYIGVIVKAPPPVIDIRKYSSWIRLIRVTAWSLRFINSCKKKKEKSKFLIPIELQSAEEQWWRWSQSDSYAEEITSLRKESPMKNSRLIQLSPFLDDRGILRMRGRIQTGTNFGQMEKNPVILEATHPYTILLIDHHHRAAAHHGQERVVNELRQRFCIPNIRVAVRKSWTNCQPCKNRRVMPVPPEMGELPEARLENRVRPFTITGVDYFGPMDVAVGRRREKRYGSLFTCLSTRAVHVEIAHSLSTDSFIMALRRFISRRGNPREIYSDNGTNFKGADNELQECLNQFDQEKIADELTNKGILWHFIPPSSPHMGGSWERLVKCVKIGLKQVLGNCRIPKDEILLTFMAEVENMVNGRPITHVSNDPTDPEALTPNHFLIGSSGNQQPIGTFDDKDLILRKQWKVAQRMADHFWTRWINEYIPTLRKRNKWFQKVDPVKVGDVVVLNEDNLPREQWIMGIITATFPGNDGQVRVVEVKTAGGTYKRPVTKIGVLDVQESDELLPQEMEAICVTSRMKNRRKKKFGSDLV